MTEGTQRRAALSNHAPRFDWHVRPCRRLFFIFISSNEKTRGASQLTGAGRARSDDIQFAAEAPCFVLFFCPETPRKGLFNKLPHTQTIAPPDARALNRTSEFQLKDKRTRNCSLGNANRVSMATMPYCEPSRSGGEGGGGGRGGSLLGCLILRPLLLQLSWSSGLPLLFFFFFFFFFLFFLSAAADRCTKVFRVTPQQCDRYLDQSPEVLTMFSEVFY